jgi:isopenicillin-N epimerase
MSDLFDKTRRSFLLKSLLGSTGMLLPTKALSFTNAGFTTNDIPKGNSDREWRKVRSKFILKSNVTYMNNASLGMPPKLVVNAVSNGYTSISEEPLIGKRELQKKIRSKTLPALARMFDVYKDDIVLTRNASEALFLQAMGVELKTGDEILVTSQEHPAGSRPWMYRKNRDNIIIKNVFIPSPLTSKKDTVNRIIKEITPKTKALSFCHITRGGHLYPVKEICNEARKRNVLSLVDGAQAVGQFPISITDLGCDAYAASLHKWILAPSGTGFLYIQKESRKRIRTLFDPDFLAENPSYDPPGTKDLPLRAAIYEAVNFVQTIGLEKVNKRCRYLSNYLKQGLANFNDVKILSGADGEVSAPGSTIFEKEGLDAVEAVDIVYKKIGTHIDEHQRDGHNAIRISTHVYNTKREIDKLLNTLEMI